MPLHNSSKISGLERTQYELEKPQIKQLEKDLAQLKTKHREFLLKDHDKSEDNMNLQDYKNFQSSLNKFKTDYKDLVDPLNSPIKESSKTDQTQQNHLVGNDNKFQFADKHAEKESNQTTKIVPLNIAYHN
ncbi:MAG: hypothetical protein GY821_10150 [Gammaproteobacteria bacterium]|nr:hypothetical protein [Gammaproteobacteria bacterium]